MTPHDNTVLVVSRSTDQDFRSQLEGTVTHRGFRCFFSALGTTQMALHYCCPRMLILDVVSLPPEDSHDFAALIRLLLERRDHHHTLLLIDDADQHDAAHQVQGIESFTVHRFSDPLNPILNEFLENTWCHKSLCT